MGLSSRKPGSWYNMFLSYDRLKNTEEQDVAYDSTQTMAKLALHSMQLETLVIQPELEARLFSISTMC